MKAGVFLPTALNRLAVVYLMISALVQTKCPYAPEPFACTTRSGILSRLKCAIFSNSRTSSNTTGPRGPTVSEFWLSPTGRPASVVIILFLSPDTIPPQFEWQPREANPLPLQGKAYVRSSYTSNI